MSLSCSCDIDETDWYYISGKDFKILDTLRRQRCCSCKKLIDIGSLCIRMERFRASRNDIEERIWGDEVALADWYLCESCGEIFLNLTYLGYCHYLGEDIREDLKEYWELTGFKRG